MDNFILQFTDYIKSCGLEPIDPVIADDTSRPLRQPGDTRTERSAVYKLKIEGDFALGFAYCFKRGETFSWFSKGDKKLTPEERSAYKQRLESQKRIRESEQKILWENVASQAQATWQSASLYETHPYAEKKKIIMAGARVHDDILLVPVQDIKGKIWSLQRILPHKEEGKSDKFFLANGRIEGNFSLIGTLSKSTPKIIICEGWATGVSLHMATNLPIIVAFNAGNLVKVTKIIYKNYQNLEIIIAADNDQWTKGNPGLTAAQAALSGIGGRGRIVLPSFAVPSSNEHPAHLTDFNDLHVTEGLDAVRRIVIDQPLAIQKENDDLNEWKNYLVRDGRGLVDGKSLANMRLFFDNEPSLKNVFVYNEFSHEILVRNCPPWEDQQKFKIHRLNDLDVIRATAHMEYHGFKPAIDRSHNAIIAAAHKNIIHPAREWFNSLVWDGTPRLDTWLTDYCHATRDDPEYLSTVGRKWLVAGVARVFNPGCKFDNMLVLEGPQNAGKSTVFRKLSTIGDESYFTDAVTIHGIDDKDSILKLQGKLIVEFAELSGFGQKDMADIKRWLTLQQDECRKPYGRENIIFHRQFIVGGTHNPIEGWLVDATGNRRFWPVVVGDKIDLEGLERDKNQLWAEAVFKYKEGEKLWMDEEMYKKAEAVQADRRFIDPWHERILTEIRGKEILKTDDILSSLGIDMQRRTMAESRRVGRMLKSEGLLYVSQYNKHTKRTERIWVKPGATNQDNENDPEKEIKLS